MISRLHPPDQRIRPPPTASSTTTPATAAGTTPSIRFDHHDFLWCPRHAGTKRHFECTRLITSAQVIRAIQSIPGVAGAAAG
jgi:hypothetical protein